MGSSYLGLSVLLLYFSGVRWGAFGMAASSLPGGIEQELQKAVVKQFAGDILSKLTTADNFNVVISLGTCVYLFLVALQSLLFSFKYSLYSLVVVCVLAVGEVGNFVPVPIVKRAAAFMTPATKGLVYLGCA